MTRITAQAYAQRPPHRDGWLDDCYRRIEATLALMRCHRRRLDRFVTLVAALGPDGERLRENEVPDAARALRQRLRVSPRDEMSVARSFALVREVARRVLGQRHHDVQLVGGWALFQGMVAEMETGEGKTLTATLAASTAALSGIHVHVVTVNDYLARRDAQWMEPIYNALGIRVGAVTQEMDHEARRHAYQADVTYCTNKQLGFDYLRDGLTLGMRSTRVHLELERLAGGPERERQLFLRGLEYAIVDELDSILIDEGDTPLIIARRQSRGMDSTGYKAMLRFVEQLRAGVHFHVDRGSRRVELTPSGREELAAIERWDAAVADIPRSAKLRQEMALQALTARHALSRDEHYMVRDGRVQIVDELTGRTLPDRAWQHGLHQAVEAKEDCAPTPQDEPIARITYPELFRRYLRLCGMTGTAREVAPELANVFGLPVLRVPAHKPVRRTMKGLLVFSTRQEKESAVVCEVRDAHRSARAVLVGTRSVEASERVSVLLGEAGLPHRVLNARQDQEEAEIIEQAGQPGSITVATNMAGRGTDIRLHPEVAARGGLHVIATDLHEAGRVDRQLFGRCGRQGEPGTCQALVSLEDDLLSKHATLRARFARRLWPKISKPIVRLLARLLFRRAQRAAERRHGRSRRRCRRASREFAGISSQGGAFS